MKYDRLAYLVTMALIAVPLAAIYCWDLFASMFNRPKRDRRGETK